MPLVMNCDKQTPVDIQLLDGACDEVIYNAIVDYAIVVLWND